METWKTIVSSIGGSAFISTVLVYLLREWISTRLRKSIEHEYKTRQIELQAKLDGKLEGVKAGYQQILSENQIRFSRLHAEQANAIKSLYPLLARMENKLKALTSLFKYAPENEEKRKKFYVQQRKEAAEAFTCCFSNFDENRFLFPKRVCTQMDKLTDLGWSVFVEYTAYDRMGNYRPNDRDRKTQSEMQLEAYKKMCGPFQQIREELEQEFRKFLGVIEGKSEENELGHEP